MTRKFAANYLRIAFRTGPMALGFVLISSCTQNAIETPGDDDTGGVSSGGTGGATAGMPNGGVAGTGSGLGGGPSGGVSGTGGTNAPTGGVGATAGAPNGGAAGSFGGAVGTGGAPLGGTAGAPLGGTAGLGATGGGGTSAGGAGGGVAGTGGGGTGGSAGGKGGTSGTGGGKAVEDDGADCTVPALPAAASLPTIAKLPDPFMKLGGTRMTTKAEWRCRREELKKQAETYAYGTKPPKPSMVSGTVTSTNITVNVSEGGKSANFSASVSLPSGTGPFPVVVILGGLGADTSTIRSEGVATIGYDPYALGREGTGRANKQGAFYTLYGSNSTTGILVAWAWGVSRIIDVIEMSGGNILRPDVGVTGCSRFGKGAFTVGVFDQRIALTMPIESGTAGVPIWRGIPGEGAQSLSSAYGEQPWFGDAFTSFTGAPTKAPIDTHELVAMIAPRGLLIMDNPHIANLGPKSGHVAALGGAEVYKALGAEANISYISNVQEGMHCALRTEWTTPLRNNLQKFLKKTGTAAGTISARSNATGNLTEWRDWTTPTLN